MTRPAALDTAEALLDHAVRILRRLRERDDTVPSDAEADAIVSAAWEVRAAIAPLWTRAHAPTAEDLEFARRLMEEPPYVEQLQRLRGEPIDVP